MSGSILSMPASQYRAAEGVSKSDLDWIAPPKTPAHYKVKRDGLIAREETAAMRLGSITHRAILEPETMAGAFAVRPDGLDLRSKPGKEWKESVGDTPVLDADDALAIRGMVASVWSHPIAKRLFSGAHTEACLFAEDGNGMRRKGRLDALPSSGSVLPDLKTTASADAGEFERSVGRYRYHVQAAYYLDLAALCGVAKQDFVFVCVEKAPPYAVAIYALDQAAIDLGRMEYQRDLLLVRQCEESGIWPAFGDEVTTIGLPAWMQKQAEGLV